LSGLEVLTLTMRYRMPSQDRLSVVRVLKKICVFTNRKHTPLTGFYPYIVFLGKRGDSYDRFLIRVREMYESVNIVFQILSNLSNNTSYSDPQKKN
jgi:Ni,Fe-hydrogenase III large subunit